MNDKELHIIFKKKVMLLVKLGREVDDLFNQNKISKRKLKELKQMISWEWDKAYNRHPYISQSIKQGFNLLYTKATKGKVKK